MTRHIPVLLYHNVSDSPSQRMAPFTVSPALFASHLDALIEHGYECLTISQLVQDVFAGSRRFGDERIAVVTFDDGFTDFASTALPLLRSHSIPATLYVTTGWMNGGTTIPTTRPDDPFLSWDELVNLSHEHVEIGAHSHTHPQMDTLSSMAVLDELIRSKSLLEDALHTPVHAFAYPHGYNSKRVRRLVREVGYHSGAAVRNTFSHAEDDPFAISRLMVFHNTSALHVKAWLEGHSAPIAPHREHPKTTLWRTYRRTKSILTGQVGTEYA